MEMKYKQFVDPQELVNFVNTNISRIRVETITSAAMDGRIHFTLFYILV